MPLRLTSFLPTSLANNLPFLSNEHRGWELLPAAQDAGALPTHKHTSENQRGKRKAHQRHRRRISLSTFGGAKKILYLVITLTFGFVLVGVVWSSGRGGILSWKGYETDEDIGGPIPLGQSRMRGGREVFWWEQFDQLYGFYIGRKAVVSHDGWISEQDIKILSDKTQEQGNDGGNTDNVRNRQEKVGLRILDASSDDYNGKQDRQECFIDEEKQILPPALSAYAGLPQGFPAALFGSGDEIGFSNDACYDRINRFGPYGYGLATEEGGIGITTEGDNEGSNLKITDFRNVRWGEAQRNCIAKNGNQPRTVFMIRTWNTFEYTPYHIMMLRAIVNELTLVSRGRYEVHFLIQVQNDSIPIWASQEVYNQTLKESLPEEFAGMGTLWSVAQMKLIYPPPFPETVINFSGQEIYGAYRSLHFPLQYFAAQHPEYDYFWEWEMDIRVTGHYLELLDRISEWADRQPRRHAWERSAKFFIPDLFRGSEDSYSAFSSAVDIEIATSAIPPVSGPQVEISDLLSPPSGISYDNNDEITDLITLNPLFDPNGTRWAFRDDITGYNKTQRPPTRAALITASRLSRRLLVTMHEETFQNKHTMFPEMYPASIALAYGYKAVYAPVPIYMDRDWPALHADLVFNNAKIPVGSDEDLDGMDHGNGRFSGDPGSVFGPGEHVFRGASYYSSTGFAGYLWRRWLGLERGNGELAWEVEPAETTEERQRGRGSGRMCLPMMVLHPIKFE